MDIGLYLPSDQLVQMEEGSFDSTTLGSTTMISSSSPWLLSSSSSYPTSRDVTMELQMDIMIPFTGREERLRPFATKLGNAIQSYFGEDNSQPKPRITSFRLLVTRFSRQEQATSQQLHQDLAGILSPLAMPSENIVMVIPSNNTTFSRGRALNLLHEHACHSKTCLIAGIDVDMEIRPDFFHHSIETVHLRQNPPLDASNAEWFTSDLPSGSTPVVYFPIMWSAYNPASIKLVERHLKVSHLPEFSEHTGHWRPSSKGMYVMSGSDALHIKYDTTIEGWGGEDVEFYKGLVALPRRIMRQQETGLFHVWHPKFCVLGKDVYTQDQHRNCQHSARTEEGSKLGRQLLQRAEKQAAKTKGASSAATKRGTPQLAKEREDEEIPKEDPIYHPGERVNLQLDIMIPFSGREDRLRPFATKLGKAIHNYLNENNTVASMPQISSFRILVTRFSPEEQATSAELQKTLAEASQLSLENVVMVNPSSNTTFSRGRALNLLHEVACHSNTCLIAGVDVDMEIRPDFFHHSIETVFLRQIPPLDASNAEWFTSNLPPDTPTVYFPIMWSSYNPSTIQLVKQHLNAKGEINGTLPEFSEHMGHWRPYSKGMYVMLGSDALKVKYDTAIEGWGGEDVDFYKGLEDLPRRILRRQETGLIHVWHPKYCRLGKDVYTETQLRNCKRSARMEEGSNLGLELRKQQQSKNG